MILISALVLCGVLAYRIYESDVNYVFNYEYVKAIIVGLIFLVFILTLLYFYYATV